MLSVEHCLKAVTMVMFRIVLEGCGWMCLSVLVKAKGAERGHFAKTRKTCQTALKQQLQCMTYSFIYFYFLFFILL